MAIHKIGSDLVRPAGPKGPQAAADSAKHSDSEEVRRVERTDRVEISPEGRELAAQMAGDGEGLSPTRVAEIEHRLGMRFYNEPSVAARVAERMIMSGDFSVSGDVAGAGGGA